MKDGNVATDNKDTRNLLRMVWPNETPQLLSKTYFLTKFVIKPSEQKP
jgi:hypothetical protein